MFQGQRCRYYSKTEDGQIQREMGTQSLDDFAIHRLSDAASPEQLDALAFQFLSLARRCKTAGSKEFAKRWKDYYRKAEDMAAAARARLAALPTKASAPELFNPRTPGKPGCLDSDFNLPFRARIDIADLDIGGVFVDLYAPSLSDGDVIQIGPSRFGKTWISLDGQTTSYEIATSTLRGLQQLGRLVPLGADEAKLAA